MENDFDNVDFDPQGNLVKIYKQESLLDILMDFEEVLDHFHVYVYENWLDAEIVFGPKLQRYWVKVILRTPYKKMPDPRGAARLVKYGCKVRYKQYKYKAPVTIKDPSRIQDYYEVDDEGKLVRKKEVREAWLVEIKMPRKFIDELADDFDVNDDDDIDIETVKDASDQGETERNIVDQRDLSKTNMMGDEDDI